MNCAEGFCNPVCHYQAFYDKFIIINTIRTLDSVTIEAIQLHQIGSNKSNLEDGESGVATFD